MIDNLYTQRSYVRCISDGYKFQADNLWMVCKVMGPYFLVSSAFLVLFNVLNTHLNVADVAGHETNNIEVVADFIALLLAIFSYIVAIRRLYVMFKRLCGKTAPASASAAVPSSSTVPSVSPEVATVSSDSPEVATVPSDSPEGSETTKGKKVDFLNKVYINKVFKAFFHHFGKIVGTVLLSLFSVVVISAVVYLPFVVSTYTYFSSIEGNVNFGDTALIPTYGYVLMFVICTLCYSIIDIISVAFYATLVFLYGDIRTRSQKPNSPVLKSSAVEHS